jgi:hypothetical protein
MVRAAQHEQAASGFPRQKVRPHLCACHREGTVVSLVTPGEAFVVEKMARKLQVDIPEVDVAGGGIKLIERRTPMRS